MADYQKVAWGGALVITIAILALAYLLFFAPRPEKVEAPVAASPSPPASQAEAPAVAGEYGDVAPLQLELDGSDAAIRELAAAESLPAVMRGWLQQKEIARTVVAAVDSIARGESPAPQLQFLAPAEKFSAGERNGVVTIDPKSFRRYDALVNAFTAVPDKSWITWYRKLLPTLEKAFAELGYPGITFAQRLRQAIDVLLEAPLPRDNAALEKRIICYAYADPRLENLNPAQKHLLRLGAENAARVQGKLRSLAAALGAGGKK